MLADDSPFLPPHEYCSALFTPPSGLIWNYPFLRVRHLSLLLALAGTGAERTVDSLAAPAAPAAPETAVRCGEREYRQEQK